MKENKKIMQFDHNLNSFGDALGISDERINEIRTGVRDIMFNTCGSHKKSELIETILEELSITKEAELFMVGTCFGVIEYMNHDNDNNGEKLKDMLKEKLNLGEDEDIDFSKFTDIVDESKFISAMKHGKDDF